MIYETMEIITKSNDKNELKDVADLTSKYRKYDNFCRRYIFNYIKGKEGFEANSLLIHLLMIQTDLARMAEIQKTKEDNVFFIKVFEHYKNAYNGFIKRDADTLYVCNRKINQEINSYKPKSISLFSHYSLEILRIMYSGIVPMLGLSLKITG